MANLGDLLASNLRGERARRRWTQAQLAERLGWPRTSIHDVETGRRRLSLADLAQLCRGADEDDLRALGMR